MKKLKKNCKSNIKVFENEKEDEKAQMVDGIKIVFDYSGNSRE